MSAATGLATQQQALLDALWGAPDAGPGAPASGHGRGLDVHRANARAHATQSLALAYPVVDALVGRDNLAGLARQLWLTHPPAHGDLARWGGALPVCIEALPDLAGLPYLADVARVEWAMHQAATAADAPPALHTLARLASDDPARLGLQLAPGTATVPSAWPVASIVQAHLGQGPTLQTCGQRLRDGATETALVWRAGWQPRVRAIDAAEHAWVQALLHGASVSDALDAALSAGAFDLGHWLARSAQDGLLIGLTAHIPLPAPHDR